MNSATSSAADPVTTSMFQQPADAIASPPRVGTIAMQAICLYMPAALAAPPTNVNTTPQILNPYQQTASIAGSPSAPQCIVKFPPVPRGKRLVVTNVPAQLGLSLESFVIEAN